MQDVQHYSWGGEMIRELVEAIEEGNLPEYGCQTCGQRVRCDEFHSYDSCLLFKIGSGRDLDGADHAYLINLAVEALTLRVAKRLVTKPTEGGD